MIGDLLTNLPDLSMAQCNVPCMTAITYKNMVLCWYTLASGLQSSLNSKDWHSAQLCGSFRPIFFWDQAQWAGTASLWHSGFLTAWKPQPATALQLCNSKRHLCYRNDKKTFILQVHKWVPLCRYLMSSLPSSSLSLSPSLFHCHCCGLSWKLSVAVPSPTLEEIVWWVFLSSHDLPSPSPSTNTSLGTASPSCCLHLSMISLYQCKTLVLNTFAYLPPLSWARVAYQCTWARSQALLIYNWYIM